MSAGGVWARKGSMNNRKWIEEDCKETCGEREQICWYEHGGGVDIEMALNSIVCVVSCVDSVRHARRRTCLRQAC